jgi:hypothetical protein
VQSGRDHRAERQRGVGEEVGAACAVLEGRHRPVLKRWSRFYEALWDTIYKYVCKTQFVRNPQINLCLLFFGLKFVINWRMTEMYIHSFVKFIPKEPIQRLG